MTISDSADIKKEVVSVEELPHKDAENLKDADIAATFLAHLDPSVARDPISSKEERRLLWKVDLTILPLILVTVVLAAIDKVIISNAAIYGMTEDAHLTGNQFSWIGSLFYFGYLAAEYPAAILIQRMPIAKFFAATILCWAILMLCTAATHNFGGLAAVRFLMGMMESFVFPVSSILTVMWWTKKEQPIRVAFWFNSVRIVFCLVSLPGMLTASTSCPRSFLASSATESVTPTHPSTRGGSFFLSLEAFPSSGRW